MAKRFVKMLLLMLVIGAFLALVAPSFINWNKHKDTLIARLSRYTKDDIKIKVAGNVSLRMIPRPELLMENVSVYKGDESNEILRLQQLGALIKFQPLLEGIIEFEYLELVNPILEVTANQQGEINDISIFKNSVPASAIGKTTAESILLNKVSILDGEIIYKNANKDIEVSLSDMDLSVEAESVLGPYNISGSMMYNQDTVGIEIKTSKYKEATPVTLNANFMPYDPSTGFPEIKYSGVLDMETELALQGELNIANGFLNKIIADTNIKSISFMQDKIKLKSVFSANKNKMTLSNIEATMGKNTTIKGELAVDFPNDKYNVITADLETKNLVLTSRPVYTNTPQKFKGKVHLKGDNFVLAGESIPYADATIEFTPNIWQINSSLYMKGSTKAQVSGKISPNGQSAAYRIKATTKDFKGFINNLPIPADNIFKSFENNALLNGASFTTDITVRPKQVALNNLVAKLGGADIKGAINIDREDKVKNFSASLSVDNLNLSAGQSKGFEDILKAIASYKTSLDVTAKNLQNNGVAIKDLAIKTSMGGGLISIDSMNASLDEKNTFAVLGKVEGVNPATMINISYSAQADKPESIAQFFGIKIPMIQSLKSGSNIKGKLKGNADGWYFDIDEEIENGKVLISGTSKDKGQSYNASINIQSTQKSSELLEAFGFPVSGLFVSGESLAFNGDISGNDKVYKIDNIKAKLGDTSFSGSVAKDENNQTNVQITTDYVDIDRFIKTPMKSVSSGITVSINGKTSWGGTLQASLTSANSTSVNVKGSITDADIRGIIVKSGIKNSIPFETGNIDFNINKSDKIVGTANVKLSSLDLPELSYDGLGYLINGFNDVPQSLEDEIRSDLNKSDLILKDVNLKLKLDGKTVTLAEPLKNSVEDGEMIIEKASADLVNKTYTAAIKIAMTKPKTLPLIRLNIASGKKTTMTGIKELEAFIVKNNPAPLELQEGISSLPTAAEAGDPVQEDTAPVIMEDKVKPENLVVEEVAPAETIVEEETLAPDEKTTEPPASKETNDAIGGILDRLEE